MTIEKTNKHIFRKADKLLNSVIGYSFYNGTYEDTGSKLKKHSFIFKKITKYRGNIIELCLFIENMLNIIISHFFFGRNYDKHDAFRGLVLEKEFFNLMNKRKLLSDIYEMSKGKIPGLDAENFNRLKRNVNDLILIRNKMAHGVIYYDNPSDSYLLEYYNGTKMIDKFDEKFIADFIDKYRHIEKYLQILNNYLQENDIIAKTFDKANIKG
jgi:hypothetical protein